MAQDPCGIAIGDAHLDRVPADLEVVVARAAAREQRLGFDLEPPLPEFTSDRETTRAALHRDAVIRPVELDRNLGGDRDHFRPEISVGLRRRHDLPADIEPPGIPGYCSR